MAEYKRKFKARLKTLRQKLGLTKEEMSEFLGLRTVSGYLPYEDGKKPQSNAFKFKIAKLLKDLEEKEDE